MHPCGHAGNKILSSENWLYNEGWNWLESPEHSVQCFCRLHTATTFNSLCRRAWHSGQHWVDPTGTFMGPVCMFSPWQFPPTFKTHLTAIDWDTVLRTGDGLWALKSGCPLLRNSWIKCRRQMTRQRLIKYNLTQLNCLMKLSRIISLLSYCSFEMSQACDRHTVHAG